MRKEIKIERLALLILVLASGVSLLKPLFRLTAKVYVDYNEGWQAHFAKLLSSGKPLYQPLESFVLNWYPPFSFHILSLFKSDFIIVGRVISLISLFITALMISMIVRKLTDDKYSSILSGLLYISFMGVFQTDYVGMNDPQLLAHALMTGGFTLFLYKYEDDKFLYISTFIMLIAGFTKHLLIPIPISISIWLFFKDRKRFYRWLIAATVLLFVFLFVAFIAHGKEFFLDVFKSPRTHRIGTIARIADWLYPYFISIIFSLFLLLGAGNKLWKNSIGIIYLYLGISFIWGAYTSGGGGVYYNSLFDFIIAVTIAAAVAISRYKDFLKIENRYSKELLSFMLFIPIFLFLPFKLFETKEFVTSIGDKKQSVESDINFIRNYENPVLVENLALSYWGDKELCYTPVNMKEKIESGFFSNDTVIGLLEKRHYNLIQLDRNIEENYCFTREILQAIDKNYQILKADNSNLVWYTPKD